MNEKTEANKQGCILFDLFPDSPLAAQLAEKAGLPMGLIELTQFPDMESYIRIDSDVKDKTIIVIARLDHPNNRFLPLMFVLDTLKELGAKKIILIAPYIPYMRQDKRYKAGEAFTSKQFANFFHGRFDTLLTIDPHLHHIHKLNELYEAECIVLHATSLISNWIKENLKSTVIIGPYKQSESWISLIAKETESPFYIMKKHRESDEKVTVSIPEIEDKTLLPVFIDDIISKAVALTEGMNELSSRGFKDPVCIGVHGIFDKDVYNRLTKAGAQQIITSNTVPNFTNKIDVTDLLLQGLKQLNLAQEPSPQQES